jgi:hypothetical protein
MDTVMLIHLPMPMPINVDCASWKANDAGAERGVLGPGRKKRINRKGDNTSAKKEGVGVKKIEKV